MKFFRVILFFLAFTVSINAQINKNGIPFITNYTTDDYFAEPQNWAVVSDKRGVLYFANNNCILEYDGNEWQKISVPADTEGAVTVGAAYEDKLRAPFSSVGNTADGRIKPDVMSWGVGVRTYYNGNFGGASGTSLSAPLITGFMADMVQAYPNVPPAQMKDYLLQSSDRFHNPDSLYGYGFPDFGLMMQTLDSAKEVQIEQIGVYPNPFSDEVNISGMIIPVEYVLADMRGRIVRRGKLNAKLRFDFLDGGMYLLIVYDRQRKRIFKLIKQP
jgi:hypothetical protein